MEEKTTFFKEYGYLIKFLIKLLVIAVSAVCIYLFVFEVHIYHGNDMYPSVKDGDLIFVFKPGKFVADDVVMFKNPENGKNELSRVFARDGGKVDFTPEGEPTLNGGVMPGSVFYRTEKLAESNVEYPCELQSGQLFVLDDYRTIGYDSRAFGTIDDDDIVGKILYVFRKRGI